MGLPQAKEPGLHHPPFGGFTGLILSSSAEIAMQFWWDYLYTGDRAFLRDRAYPLMKQVAAFYVNYLEKDAQGRYNMDPSNAHETFWAVKNPTTDLAALRYFFPSLIQASTILGVDADLRPVWQDRLDHLAPYALDPASGAILPYELRPGEQVGSHNGENPDVFPIGVFPDITVGSPDLPLGIRTFYHRVFVNANGWTTDSICAARLGLADTPAGNSRDRQMGLADLLKIHIEDYQDHPSGLQDYFNRTPAIHPYLEGSGTFSTAVGEMLLQPWNGAIRVCPALPKAWSADFKLLATGGFEVTGHAEKGKVVALSLLSERGEAVVLANPWGAAATVTADGKTVLNSAEALLQFPTQAGKTYLVTPAGVTWQTLTITAAPNEAPKHLAPDSRRWIGKPPSAGLTWQATAEANPPRPPVVPAQIERSANPAVQAVRFPTAPKIDGELDDPVWKTAPSLGPFFLLGQHTPATQQTDVYVGYDDSNLYVGMVCWEAHVMEQTAELEPIPENRDRHLLLRDDSVEFFLVTPGQTWHFAANILGARYDALGPSAAAEDARLNPEWIVATSRHGNRWILEAAIPFTSLTADGPYAGEQWGVNFCRNEQPGGETSTWAPLTRADFWRTSEFGKLTFAALPPAPAPADPDLVGHWDFAHLRGQWVQDSSGHRHGGFLTSLMPVVAGAHGPALDLTGAGYVDIASAPDLNPTDGMTIALWVNPKSQGEMRLVDKGAVGNDNGYMLDTYPDGNLRVITSLGAMRNPVELPPGEWSHVAVTYDGQALRLYLNGKLLQETRATGKISATDFPLKLGADSNGASHFVGLMADVRVYRRALSAEELAPVMAGMK
jgi:hypothetical protein